MKFEIIVLLGLILSVSAVPVEVDIELQQKLAKGFLDFLQNLATEVFLPPIITAVQDVAGLAAQVTAGIHEGGIDAILGLFGKRDLDQQKILDIINYAKGNPKIWDALTEAFQTVVEAVQNGLYDQANSLAQQLGLTLTQILSQISQGKRDLDQQKIFNILDILGNLNIPQIIDSLGQHALDLGLEALMNIINSANGNPKIWDALTEAFQTAVQAAQNHLYDAANSFAQQAGLTLTQILSQISQGKRSLEQFNIVGFILNFIRSFDLQTVLTTQFGLNSALATQVASIFNTIVNFIASFFGNGKRSVEQDKILSFITNLLNSLGDQVMAQLPGIFNNVIAPALHLSAQQAAAMLAQVTAAVAVDGLPALNGLFQSLFGGFGKK